jgi:hypothetical protein
MGVFWLSLLLYSSYGGFVTEWSLGYTTAGGPGGDQLQATTGGHTGFLGKVSGTGGGDTAFHPTYVATEGYTFAT